MSKFISIMLSLATADAHRTAPLPFPAANSAPNTTTTTALVREERIEEIVDVSPVWAGHIVGFDLVTRGGYQFAAFYDADRNMTVGQRKLGEKSFQLTCLPTQVGWDSHNNIDLDLDDDGYIHVSGNMHGAPRIIYFRSTKPFDASTLEEIPQMVGPDEARVTYPRFFRGPGGQFIFAYRQGSSGNGNQIYNVYDLKTRSWHRLLDKPLFDGEGQRNAYPTLPTPGPDGYFHIVWVWREAPDAASNRDPSYARSRDLVHWENSKGEALPLPITLASGDVVDTIPEKGGVINNNVKVGFDAQKRVIVSYHKYDEKGNTQIYNARCENGAWIVTQVSDWNYRWDFGGGGTLQFEVNVGGVKHESDGTLTQYWWNKRDGEGTWILDPQTLKPIGLKPPTAKLDYPAALRRVESEWPGMEVRWQPSLGQSDDPNTRYVMRWETLPSNRDQPRPEPYPPASMLRIYRLKGE